MNTDTPATTGTLDISSLEHFAAALKAFLDGGDPQVLDQIEYWLEALKSSQTDQGSTHESNPIISNGHKSSTDICGAFWAHVLGKDIRKQYLSFLELVKSADQWVKTSIPQSIVEGMKTRNDPIAIQRVITSYVLQDSLSGHDGMARMERIICLAEYWKHWKALCDDSEGVVRRFLRDKIDWESANIDWKAAALGYIICVVGGHDLEAYYEGIKKKVFTVFEILVKMMELNKQTTALELLRTRFGAGVFVFLVDIQLATYTVCGGIRREKFTKIIDSLALHMPATVTICQQMTSALIEPLRRDEMPVDLKTTLDLDQCSLLELVSVTTRELVHRKAGQRQPENGAQDPDCDLAQQLQNMGLGDIKMDGMELDEGELDNSEMEIDDEGTEDA